MQQNNVIYGAFGQRTAPLPGSMARLPENTPATLQNGLLAQLRVLKELAELINDPELPKEIAEPLRTELQQLEEQAQSTSKKMSEMHDNRVFLEVQSELKDLGAKLVAFEADVLHKTGASIEVIEPAPHTGSLQQPQTQLAVSKSIWNSPKFWLGLGISVAAFGGLVWWGVYGRNASEDKEPMYKTIQKVKLRKALPAR
jgi:hypothetical protein